MSRPPFPDAAKPTRVNPWNVIGFILAGAVVAVVIGWLFLNPVLQ
jgi:hypothetical protein